MFHHPKAIFCEFGQVLRSFRQSFTPSGSLGCGGSLFQLWIWTSPSLLQAVLRKSNITLENPAFWTRKSSILRWTLQKKNLGKFSTWRWKIQQDPRQSKKNLENPACWDGPCLGRPRVHFHLPTAISCYVFQGFDFGLYRYIYIYI